jgi:hypothetical protein
MTATRDCSEQARKRRLAAERKRYTVTRAPHASEKTPNPRPLRRLVIANGEEVVVEITENLCVIRPRRSRKPLCSVTWGQIILRSLNAPPSRGRR